MKYESYGLIKENWDQFVEQSNTAEEDLIEENIMGDLTLLFDVANTAFYLASVPLTLIISAGSVAGAKKLADLSARKVGSEIDDRTKELAQVDKLNAETAMDLLKKSPKLVGQLAKQSGLKEKLAKIQEKPLPEPPLGPDGEYPNPRSPEWQLYQARLEKAIKRKMRVDDLILILDTVAPENVVKQAAAAEKRIETEAPKEAEKQVKGLLQRIFSREEKPEPSGMFSTVGRKK